MRRRKPPRWPTVAALVASLVVHPLVIVAVMLLSAWTASHAPKRPKSRPVSLQRIDPRAWAANRGRAAPDDRPAPLHPMGQVVDVAMGNGKVDPNAKYLAETNNQVAKQTRAREQSAKYSVAAAKNSATPEQMPAAQGRAGGKQQQAVSIANQLEHFSGVGGARPRLSELLQQVASNGQLDDAAPGSGEGGLRPGQGDQPVGADAVGSATGGAAPNDNLNDVEKGDGTYLNTREWKYAAFFNRVKQAVSAHWDPNGRLKKKDPSGRRAGFSDRVTVLTVTLRPDGTIADLFVQKTCGLDELDQEAMASFEKAQPFTNPPPQLVENGFIRFAFGFSVTNDGNPLQRMFGMGR